VSRLNTERVAELTPHRVAYADNELFKLGYECTYHEEGKYLSFEYKGNEIRLWPFSGWHSGKGIKDGRGINSLLRKLIC
jgi:hypothetical protein